MKIEVVRELTIVEMDMVSGGFSWSFGAFTENGIGMAINDSSVEATLGASVDSSVDINLNPFSRTRSAIRSIFSFLHGS